jgi:hypothetical protein
VRSLAVDVADGNRASRHQLSLLEPEAPTLRRR